LNGGKAIAGPASATSASTIIQLFTSGVLIVSNLPGVKRKP
jgi:hypothetical protein